MAKDVRPWQRREDESAQAYAAFCSYYVLPPRERSIDLAWKSASKARQKRDGKRAPGNWAKWSAQFNWVKRAAAHDEHVAEQERLKWVERRRQLQEADWQDGQAVRKLVMEALPEASRFIERKEVRIKGTKGQPDQLIITESFNIVGLVRALSEGDKLQRLATGDSTENVQLTGAALDSYIASQLARLAGVEESKEDDGSDTNI